MRAFILISMLAASSLSAKLSPEDRAHPHAMVREWNDAITNLKRVYLKRYKQFFEDLVSSIEDNTNTAAMIYDYVWEFAGLRAQAELIRDRIEERISESEPELAAQLNMRLNELYEVLTSTIDGLINFHNNMRMIT